MAPRTDFLTQQRQQIDARLQQLRPAHEEYLTLLEAKRRSRASKSRLGPASTGSPRSRPPARIRQREAFHDALARVRERPPPAAPGRDAGVAPEEPRADQALQLIKSNPGITVPQIADKMGIRQNYLYRVTAALQKARLGEAQGTGIRGRLGPAKRPTGASSSRSPRPPSRRFRPHVGSSRDGFMS